MKKPGTHVGDEMLARASRSGWGGPCWDHRAAAWASGGVEPGEAQFLYGLVRAMRPEVVLEVGTSFGWSGLHLAAGLRDNGLGKLYTVEINLERQAAARLNFKRADLEAWADCLSMIPNLPRVDLALLDAGHEADDITYYLAALPRDTGLVVVHDATWEQHVEKAIAHTDWKALYLPGTSYAGLALLQLRGAP